MGLGASGLYDTLLGAALSTSAIGSGGLQYTPPTSSSPSVPVLIQTASNTFAPTDTTSPTPATLTSTNTAYTFVSDYGGRILTAADNGGGYRDTVSTVSLSSTSLSNTRASTSAATGNVRFDFGVVQFPSNIVESVQTATVTLTTTSQSGTATLTTPVTKARSVVIVQQGTSIRVNSNSLNNIDHYADISADGTQVTVTASTLVTSITRVITVQVIQFVSAAVKNRSDYTISIATSSATGTASLSSLNSGAGVNDANTVIFPRGQIQTGTASSNANVGLVGVSRSGNTITATRGLLSATLGFTVQGTAIEFNSGYLSVQNSSATIASLGTSATGTITSISTSRSFLLMSGYYTSYTASTNEDEYEVTVALTNSTTWTATRTNGGTSTVTVPMQIITFS